MERITQHPIRSKLDALARGLASAGFSLRDDCASSEVVASDWSFSLFEHPDLLGRRAIALEEDGRFSLRTNLLTSQLADMAGDVPLRAFSLGRVFDGADADVPARWVVEGVVVEERFNAKEWERVWERVAQSVFGLAAEARLAALGEGAYAVECTVRGEAFEFARMGTLSEIARTLLGLARSDASAWAFSIDADALALRECALDGRAELYRPVMSFLERFEGDRPSAGSSFARRAIDVMRAQGYREFFGVGLYAQDAYQKMNMIMESWDLNNRGALLQQPIGGFTRVPTVLTPSLQDALEANFAAGEEWARIFEVNHHYVLEKIGAKPVLKTSLSFGAYGPDIDRASFRAEVDAVLTKLGVANHFFIPTDMAIPYDPSDCWVLLDERMQYLGGNFGTICQKARDAHRIGVPAFMAQLELPLLERKAAEELRFEPPESR